MSFGSVLFSYCNILLLCISPVEAVRPYDALCSLLKVKAGSHVSILTLLSQRCLIIITPDKFIVVLHLQANLNLIKRSCYHNILKASCSVKAFKAIWIKNYIGFEIYILLRHLICNWIISRGLVLSATGLNIISADSVVKFCNGLVCLCPHYRLHNAFIT